MDYPPRGLPTIERLVGLFSRLPGVGRKSSQRMVYHLLRRGSGEIVQLVAALQELQERVHPCGRCHNLAEGELCRVCADERRNPALLCVVEESGDVLAIERTGGFDGRFHVLGGRLNPLEGVGPEELNLATLEQRLRDGTVREVIIATSSTIEGEASAHLVAQLCRPLVEKVTRLAFGLPMGGELEYLDESTLYQALAGRRGY